jgi:predicted RNA-binding protein with PUA-like domain
MALWLFKEEPDHYNFADLQRDGRTVWDGVSNNLALKYLRQVRPGDRVLYYHTGKEKAVVGEMRVITEPRVEEGQGVRVEVEAVRALPQPVPLARIKQDALLADWELVRLPRLSVMPVTPQQWQRIEELSRPGNGVELGKTPGTT